MRSICRVQGCRDESCRLSLPLLLSLLTTFVLVCLDLPSSVSAGPCGTLLYGPFNVSANLNCALPMFYLWEAQYPSMAGYGDVSTDIVLYPGGGTLHIDGPTDSSSSQWCWTYGACTGPEGDGETLLDVGDPPAGWPGSTGSYPINSLGYRIAAAYANASTSIAEYAPVFNSSTLNSSIALPVSSEPLQLFLADLDWQPADDSGSVYVTVAYTPSAAACALLTASSSSSGAARVVGDPQFIGLLGQRYQVHGLDGAVYALISERRMQLNARFRFLTGPRSCPVMPSTQLPALCWSHPGSYLAELGLLVAGGEEQAGIGSGGAKGETVGVEEQRVFVAAGSAGSGFSTVQVNGAELGVGQSVALVHSGSGSDDQPASVQRVSSHELVVVAGSYEVVVENSDGFVNLRSVRPTVPLHQLRSHGLLGQTWQRNTGGGGKGGNGVLQGEIDDYVITEDTVFGREFAFNQYLSENQQDS